MAGKESGKLLEYVQNKNPDQLPTRQTKAPDGIVSFEDLRYTQSGTKATPNSWQARSNDRYPRESAQAHGGSQGGQRDPTKERTFYDTDASSIGASSTAAIPNQGIVSITRSLQNGRTNGCVTGVKPSEREDGADEDSSDEEHHRRLPQNQLRGVEDGLNDHQCRLMAEADHRFRRARLSGGDTLPYIKGDSYPVTTSGNASAGDSIEMKIREEESQEERQTQDQARQYASMRAPQITANAQNQAQPRPAQARHDSDRSAVQYRLIARPDSGEEGLLEHQVNTRFAYGNPNRSQPALRPAVKSHQDSTIQAVTTQPPVSNNTAHRATVSSVNDRSNVRPHLAQETVQTAGKRMEPQQHHQRKSKSQNERRTFTPVEHQGIVAPLEDDEVSDVDVGVEDGQSANDGMQQHVVEPERRLLDYNAEDLLKMDYRKLKAESFDAHPNAKDSEFLSDQQGTDLNSKLDAVAALSQQQQGNFFASLPIMEWEQAGDWFITHFGAILNKLKTNRQEKREAAKAFEEEIENRHETVGKKRKQTEDELSEMKQSGVKVLLRETPKKLRTK